MKRFLFLIIILLLTVWAKAQTQQGYVKSIGRPDKPGKMLAKVTIQAKGMFNAVISDTTGFFNIAVPGKQDGDPIIFLRVQKNGYELKDKGLIGRQHVFSSTVPIVIQMVDLQQLAADKQRIEDNAYRVAEENYEKKRQELQAQLDSTNISAERYRQELASLEERYESYLSLISDMADRYARTDYDNLDSIDYQINICIENGEFDKADSLIHTVFDPETVLERNRAAKREIAERIALAQSIIDKATAEREALLQDIEYAKRVVALCHNLAQEYILADNKEKAKECLEKSLAIEKILYGDDSYEAKHTQSQIEAIDKETPNERQ